MGLQGFSSGWGGVDDYDSEPSGSLGGGGSGEQMSRNERLYKFRFSVPNPFKTEGRFRSLVPGGPATKRVLFLSEDPFKVWEHSLWSVDNSFKRFGSFTAMCTSKNPIVRDKPCPLCQNLKGRDKYPAFLGVFPIVDMGQVEYRGGKTILHHDSWEDGDGNVQLRSFDTKLLAAKRGSQGKPGVLVTLSNHLNRLRAQKGIDSLLGTVWDTTRAGQKEATIGGAWDYIERVSPADLKDYLVNLGAEPEKLDLDPVVFHSEDGSGVFDVDPGKYYRDVGSIVGVGSGGNGGHGNSSGRVDNGPNCPPDGYPMPGDDDIPF